MTSRVFAGALAVVAVACASMVGASAARVSGLRTNDLGAATAVTSTHTSGLTVTWAAALSGANFVLNGIVVKTVGADTFSNEKLRVALVDTTGASVCELTASTGVTTAVTIARAAIDAACGSSGIAFSRIDRVSVSAAT